MQHAQWFTLVGRAGGLAVVGVVDVAAMHSHSATADWGSRRSILDRRRFGTHHLHGGSRLRQRLRIGSLGAAGHHRQPSGTPTLPPPPHAGLDRRRPAERAQRV